MSPTVIPGAEELGVQRLCQRCGEPWPVDEAFWYPRRARRRDRPKSQPGGWHSYCRACYHERSAAKWRARKAGR